MSKYKFVSIDQPAGRFYISTINAKVLIPISQSNERTPYNSTGIQRRLSNSRVKEIAKYCESSSAMFPTPIILSADSNYFNFHVSNTETASEGKNNEQNESQYENLKSGYLEILEDKIIKDEKFLSIVDGQHRLAGIAEYENESKFDLLVMFVFDTEPYQDAEIFSVINRNQKQVSKSLVYDLYGLSNDMTVEKFAHEIVSALNTRECSQLKNRIKMLGYKTDNFDDDNSLLKQYVSQGAIVDELIRLISRNRNDDNYKLKNGEKIYEYYEDEDEIRILRKYFVEDNTMLAQIHLISFFNEWINIISSFFDENTIMFKTIGFVSAIDVFRIIYSEMDFTEENQSQYSGLNLSDDRNENYETFKYIHPYSILYKKM